MKRDYNETQSAFSVVREEFFPMTDMLSKVNRGTLKEREPHPAAADALAFIGGLSRQSLAMWQESFSSCAIEGNRLAEVCSETLRRLINGEPISDRYLLGLAWSIREEKRMGQPHH